MRKSKRKLTSNTDGETKPKNVRYNDHDEDSTSDSDSDSDKAGNNKPRRNPLRASTKAGTIDKNETSESGEDDDFEPDGSEDEFLLVKLKKGLKEARKNDKKVEVKAIVSNKSFKGKMKYFLKWKDGSETWETKKKTTKVCPDILRQYIEQANKALEVEAVVSHRKKNSAIKYLIKWRDHSQGETWETEFRAKQLCPELVTLYVQEMEMAERQAIEVEAIVEHKKVHNKLKYLIKWKDHSKPDTWETVRKTIKLCPDILDEYMKDKPDAQPPSDYFSPACWWYKETKDKPKRNRNLFGRKKLSDEEDDDDESDENTDWEVERIVKHRIKSETDWEFLIRWKGCTAKDDTWEAEEDLNCPDLLFKYLAEVPDSMGKGGRPEMKRTDRNSKKLTARKKNKRKS